MQQKVFPGEPLNGTNQNRKITVMAVANILRDVPSGTSTQMHPSLYGESMTWCTCVEPHDQENACSYFLLYLSHAMKEGA